MTAIRPPDPRFTTPGTVYHMWRLPIRVLDDLRGDIGRCGVFGVEYTLSVCR